MGDAATREERAKLLGLCPKCEHGHEGVECGLCPCPAPARLPADTSNRHTVARTQRGIFVFRPPHAGELLTDDDALLLAAWLVAMVENGPERLGPVLRAVMGT